MTVAEQLTRTGTVTGMITLENVSWELYEMLRHETDEQHVRITYDDGRMVLVSPRPIHERMKTLAARLIEFATFELEIPISCFGSTTWKRQDLAKGLEADECYYIQSEPRIHGRTDIDLKHDPAPDLAIEIDITNMPIHKPGVYAALGVRELWQFDGERFVFVRRTKSQAYEPIAASEALPFLTPEIIDRFTQRMLSDENAGLRAFRDWLRSLPQ